VAAAKIAKHDERVIMPSAIQIASKLRLLKLKLPPSGMNPHNYDISPSKKYPRKPLAWVGNFAYVSPATRDDGESKALRFFLAKTPSHITQVTSFISNNPHYALVKCKMYRNQLTMKDGENVDMMEMDFIDGNTLDDYVGNVLESGSPESLIHLAEKFRSCVNELVQIGFHHGDLSHSNIMITNHILDGESNGEIRLIDYDSVLVKGVQAPPNTKEVGHPNYQHPSRKTSRFTLVEDVYFSALVVYVSLVAIGTNPKLWDSYHSIGDNLIFQNQRNDLKEISTPVWSDLDRVVFPGETSRAYECLKLAVLTPILEGSIFHSKIEEWFSLNIGPIDPWPSPPLHPQPLPPRPPTSGPNPEIPESPKPKPREKTTKTTSPRPRTKSNVRASPSPVKKKKGKKTDPVKDLVDINNSATGKEPQPKHLLEKLLQPWRKKRKVQDELEEIPDRPAIPDTGDEEISPTVQPPVVKESVLKSNTVKEKSKPRIVATKKKPKTIPVPISKLKGKKVVIDGTNVLYLSSKKRSFPITPLLEFISLLETHDIGSINIVFDASTPYNFATVEDKETFTKLVSEEKEIFTLAPKATEADSIILNIAHQNEALVITNDFYEDYSQSLPEAHQWFTEHHITIARAMDVWTLNTTPENMFME
jgi:hypothetical protein